jgi:hypothetical protein
MQTTPTSGLANLMLDLDPGNARMSAARDPGTSSSRTVRSKDGNSITADRRSAGEESSRAAPLAPEADTGARQPASRAKPSNAKAEESGRPTSSDRPRSTTAGNTTRPNGKQATAANATSTGCAGAAFAAVLQQVGQAQTARNIAVLPPVASGKVKTVPVKGLQAPSLQPAATQGQTQKAAKAAAPTQTPPIQGYPAKGMEQAADPMPPRTSKETKPAQTRPGSQAQPAPAGEAKPLAAALKPVASLDGAAAVVTVVPPQQVQRQAAPKATAPDMDKMAEVRKVGEKPAGRREQAPVPIQAAKLNQARTAGGDATVRLVTAEGGGAAQAASASAQGPLVPVSDSPLAKAAEAGVQGTSREVTQADVLQQAADTPVSDQILRSIRAGGAKIGQQIIVNLTPPELGKVRVTLRLSGHQVHGILEAENPDTMRRLEREAAGLTQRLSDAGVDVRRLEVVLARQDGQAASENPHAGNGSRRHPDAEPEAARQAAAARIEVPEETPVVGTDLVGSGGINVRV